MPEDSVGGRIKACRKVSGHSQAWLARALGINRSTVSRYEKGITEKITLSTLEKIADLLGTTCEYLCYGKGPIHAEAISSEDDSKAPAYLRSPGPLYAEVKKESELTAKTIPQICRSGRFIMRVETEDLAPRIVPGDLLTVVVSDTIKNKYISVLFVDGKIKIRRVTCDDAFVTFMPVSGSLYPEIHAVNELQDTMQVIGYVERLESGKP